MTLDEASPMPPAPPLGAGQRLIFRVMLALLGLARRLPDRPVYQVAYAVGAGLSVLMPARRAKVRANLRRVCTWLADNDMASPRVARASRDEAALGRMVRAAFGHWVLGYAEAALGPGYSGEELARRIKSTDPEATADALRQRGPDEVGPLHIAMHFGSVDLSALYGVRVGKLLFTGPMELVEQPLARAWFEHVRGELGATIVPLEGAAPKVIAALQRGEAAGLVADRNVVGRGAAVELFGATARLPIGPAAISLQTGATIYLQAIERRAPGAWIGHTIVIPHDGSLSRRDATRLILDQEARGIERIVARAPEQWMTLFFDIWRDEAAT